MAGRIAASIEISPRQALESADLPGLFPAGTLVYLTDVGTDSAETIATGARRVKDLGYRAVPHFASRRLTTRKVLENRIAMLASEAGVDDVLVVGGGLEAQAGEYGSSLEVLETGLFDRYGVRRIGVAGHPEGSPDFSESVAEEALKLKQAFAERTGAEMRIVTQFGFDAKQFIRWADGLSSAGVDLPVHLGVAGPAKLTTLVKFAALCGVGNSIAFLKKRAGAISTLVSGFDPDEVVEPVERHVAANPDGAIRQIHVFPFGGMKKAAGWLRQRGSWPA
ncbi:MAG: methylenetetrahydrofolate reductase [Gammaproteobacteria bacterium]|nr:methylenetetrahydrofolate reductase [Gammaproteobacteria bacterium]